MAKKYGVTLHLKSFQTEEYANTYHISIQMAARELRYKWFDQLLALNNLDFIITGHHQNDNIETFLINLIRGTGINGLCGIKAKNKNIIRPLLQISREEIEEYLCQNNYQFCIDSTNTDVKYLRNKIRHMLVPLLKDINSSIEQTIIDEISFFSGVNNIFQKEIGLIRDRLITEKKNVHRIKISELINLESLEIILFEILRPFGFLQINKIINAINSQSGKQFFSANYQLIIDREEIIISSLENIPNELEVLELTTEIQAPVHMKFNISSDTFLDKNSNIAKLDFDKLLFPLKLRKWKDGDKFKPLGMNNFKKLSDFFIDEKYSIFDKQQQWILCSGDDIIWIVGNRIDDRYKIDTNTKKVYIAEILKLD